MKLNLGCLVLRPVFNYGHKSLIPMVTVIQALYCIIIIQNVYRSLNTPTIHTLKRCTIKINQLFKLHLISQCNYDTSPIGNAGASIRGLTSSVLDHRWLPPEFEPRRGYIWKCFIFWLRFITFGDRSAHLAYQVHKSGRKTSIIIIIIITDYGRYGSI